MGKKKSKSYNDRNKINNNSGSNMNNNNSVTDDKKDEVSDVSSIEAVKEEIEENISEEIRKEESDVISEIVDALDARTSSEDKKAITLDEILEKEKKSNNSDDNKAEDELAENKMDVEDNSAKMESAKEDDLKDKTVDETDKSDEKVDNEAENSDNGAEKSEENNEKDNKENIKDSSDNKDNKELDSNDDKTKTKNDDKPNDGEDTPYVDSSIYYYKKKKKRTKIILSIVGSIILLVYIGGVIFHSMRFGSKTFINDIDISGKSIDEVEKIFTDDMNQYTLDIIFKNGTETLKKGDGGIDLEFKKSIKEIKSQQNAFLWFIDLFTEDHYTLDYKVVYDKKTLSDYVLGFDYFLPFNMQPSIDAKVEMAGGEVIVTPEKLGTKMDLDLVMDAVYGALDSFQTKVDLVNERCYIPAQITEDSEQIINTKKNAETYLAIKAKLDFGDYKYQIPRKDLSDMAYLDENGQVVISKRNVEVYARKLDEKFTTIDKNREFITHDNKKILIWGDGYYGWEIDPVKEAEDLYEYMKRKHDFTKEISCITRGYAMSDLNDIGESYVEVDLEDQHVYLYINGRLILDSDCVSGRPSMLTPGGLYGLTYKAYDATLKGEDYETKVSFWMPFNWDIGLHDAIWRADFGGDIYTYDGSHGCVNLPYDVANTIFDYIDGGFPIVCYWDSEVTVLENDVNETSEESEEDVEAE